jgi:hypothetical protein
MHLPSDSPYLQSLTQAQRFCVEFWYGQTFSSSLDSYRVRLHNGRTILKELAHEIRIQIGKAGDLQVIGAEALEICTEDEALLGCLGPAYESLRGTLTKVVDDKALKDGKESPWELPIVKRLRFLLEDVQPRVEIAYLRRAFNCVRDHLQTDTAPFEKLRDAVGSLLTDLVDRGWTLESLHEWALNLSGKKGGERLFDDRLTFLERQIMRKDQPFEVCLRLSGSPALAKLGSFKGWTFSASGPHLINPPREVTSYLRTNPQTAFASCEVTAVDFKSASHAALEAFEECLDRLRFNFLDAKVQCDSRMLIVRSGDQKPRMERVAFPVPNPVFTTNLTEFRRNSEQIDELLQKDTLDRTSRERLTSAARHYRLGQDSDSYRDKLLNWWFGFEYLTKVSNQGSIGAATTQHGKNCMVARYVLLLLLDLEPSLRQVMGNWPQSVVTLLECGLTAALPPEKLLQAMQDRTCRAYIDAAIAGRPWLQVRFQELANLISDADELDKYVDAHALRVERQLKRLYRVRCCLVHGSPMVLRLMLLCANLEFYLRETIVLVLRTMLRHSQITSLGDFYDRLRFSLERRSEILNATASGSPPDVAGILDGIVTPTR